MPKLTVNANKNYAGLIVFDVNLIDFTGAFTATFGNGQFDAIHIHPDVAIDGSAGLNNLVVEGGSIDASLWTFTNWSNAADFVQLSGSGSADTIIGSSRRDIIYGGGDVDTIEGRDGPDTIFGDGGDDIITGGVGIDSLFGGKGNDSFLYTKSTQIGAGEFIHGEGGSADTIKLNGADKVFDFSPANIGTMEKLHFLQGATAIFGATQLGGAPGITSVEGSGDADVVSIETLGEDIDISAVTFASWNAAVDQIIIRVHDIYPLDNLAVVRGSDRGEHYEVGAGAQVSCGGGDDTIEGAGTYIPRQPAVSLDGGLGSDTATLASGTFAFTNIEFVTVLDGIVEIRPYVNSTGFLDGVTSFNSVGDSDLVVDFEDGEDFDASSLNQAEGWDSGDTYTFRNAGTVQGTDRNELFSECEVAVGGGGIDFFSHCTQAEGGSDEDGFLACETAIGGNGRNEFEDCGLATGGTGTDIFLMTYARTSQTSYDGGGGNDELRIEELGQILELDSHVYQLANIETLLFFGGTSLGIDVELLADVTRLRLQGTAAGGDAAAITIAGNSVDVQGFAVDWSDALAAETIGIGIAGTQLSDTLSGGSERNEIRALESNDTLSGGGGDDLLTGGAGRDRLTGGDGADTFIFESTGDSGVGRLARDVITDFSQGSDAIQATFAGFTFLGSGNFTSSGIAELRFVALSNITSIYGDTDGDGSAEMEIRLIGQHVLTAADILV